MAKIALSIKRRCAELAQAGVHLREQQVDYAISNGLARLDDPPAQWLAIESIRRGRSLRMPEADVAAVELALSGVSCDRLPEALIRFGAIDDRFSQAEAQADKFMTQASTTGDERDKPYGAKLARRFLAAADDPWPDGHTGEATAENVDLHKLGRAQAVATDLAEIADGAMGEVVIDSADAVAVTGFDAQQVSMTVGWLDKAFGTGWLRGLEDSIRNAEPDHLVAATKAANDLLPIYEQVVVPVGEDASRWQVLAAIVPIMLALPELLAGLDRDPRLFTELLQGSSLPAIGVNSRLPIAESQDHRRPAAP